MWGLASVRLVVPPKKIMDVCTLKIQDVRSVELHSDILPLSPAPTPTASLSTGFRHVPRGIQAQSGSDEALPISFHWKVVLTDAHKELLRSLEAFVFRTWWTTKPLCACVDLLRLRL